MRRGDGRADMGAMNAELERSVDVSRSLKRETAALSAALDAVQTPLRGFSKTLKSDLQGAFGTLLFEGGKLSDVFRNMAQSMAQRAFQSATDPLLDGLSSAVTTGLSSVFGRVLPFEKGGAFSQGRVQAFAKGGVVSQATNFPMRGGLGLMGEAGPEAIMPLQRGADGSLGVRAETGRATQVTVNIHATDVKSFQKSRSQIAGTLARAVEHAGRNR